jgi:hypothetical protein
VAKMDAAMPPVGTVDPVPGSLLDPSQLATAGSRCYKTVRLGETHKYHVEKK